MFKMLAILAVSGLATTALAQQAPVVSGTVKKVDTAQNKLTIDHGPIANLDMSEMTMVFKAASSCA